MKEIVCKPKEFKVCSAKSKIRLSQPLWLPNLNFRAFKVTSKLWFFFEEKTKKNLFFVWFLNKIQKFRLLTWTNLCVLGSLPVLINPNQLDPVSWPCMWHKKIDSQGDACGFYWWVRKFPMNVYHYFWMQTENIAV